LLMCGLLRKEDRKTDDDLVLTLQNYALILICRFLEIWGQFNALAKDDRRVLEITRALSPYLDRINEWPGLKDFRDWILAHKYQIDRRPEFVPPWEVLNTGRVPAKAPEMLVLLDCVQQAVACTMAYYGDILRDLAPVLRPSPEGAAPHGALTGEEAQNERIRLALLATERLRPLGVNMNDPVFREFLCSPPQDDKGR